MALYVGAQEVEGVDFCSAQGSYPCSFLHFYGRVNSRSCTSFRTHSDTPPDPWADRPSTLQCRGTSPYLVVDLGTEGRTVPYPQEVGRGCVHRASVPTSCYPCMLFYFLDLIRPRQSTKIVIWLSTRVVNMVYFHFRERNRDGEEPGVECET